MKRLCGRAGYVGAIRCWSEAELIYEPRYLWIGAYWRRFPRAIELYICVLPAVAVRLYFQRVLDLGGRS